jgi:outer membrane protein insertion porin family/translocation and assembly module TamA
VNRWSAWLIAAMIAVGPAGVGAQSLTCDERGDVEVRKLTFSGNESFKDAELANGVVTSASSWTKRWLRFMGTKRCFVSDSLTNDRFRLMIFYRNHGYTSVAVDTSVTKVGRSAVDVNFSIREGPPTIVDTLRVLGLDSIPEARRLTAQLPLRQGSPFDKYALQHSIDTLTRRLRNGGYPSAEVFFFFTTDTAQHSATVEIDVAPGTRASIGEITLEVTPRIEGQREVSDAVVRRLLGVRSGDLYRESSLERAKRSLYQTDLFSVVAVDVDSADVTPPGDSLVAVRIALTEGLMQSARLGGGYGTLDCFRTEGEYTNANLFGAARRFQAQARLSKIGIGRPFGGAPGLCPTLRDDPYSDRLNYYGGLTLASGTDRFWSFRPSATLYSERRSEYNAFLRETPLGFLMAANRQIGRSTITSTYQLELGRTEAQPAVFCALQSACTPADRDLLLRNRRLAVGGLAWSQDWSDNAASPTRGGVVRLDLRTANEKFGSDPTVEFVRGTADIALYRTVRRGIVLAIRARVGTVTGPDFRGSAAFIPQQERLFAGGPTSVRGFEQSDLGPKLYIARGFDTVRVAGATGPIAATETVFFRARNESPIDRPVPTGGNSLIVGNVELRMPFPVLTERLSWTLFADAGELWTAGAAQDEDRFQGFKVTPGVGFRVNTPFGVLRMDVAYNRYAARTGAAYYDTPILAGGQLYCVSPGNTLPVTGLGVSGTLPTQATGSCPTDFNPGRFAQRLRFSFAIGQAF